MKSSAMREWPLLLVLVFATTAAAEPVIERQATLRHLVLHDCGSCHGMTLKGGLGPALLPDNLEGKDRDALVEIVLDGIPRTPMPPWRPRLSEADARWIVDELKGGGF